MDTVTPEQPLASWNTATIHKAKPSPPPSVSCPDDCSHQRHPVLAYTSTLHQTKPSFWRQVSASFCPQNQTPSKSDLAGSARLLMFSGEVKVPVGFWEAEDSASTEGSRAVAEFFGISITLSPPFSSPILATNCGDHPKIEDDKRRLIREMELGPSSTLVLSSWLLPVVLTSWSGTQDLFFETGSSFLWLPLTSKARE